MPAPTNDDIADATRISGTGGSFSGTTVGATREPGEGNTDFGETSGSVWFVYTAEADGVAQFNLSVDQETVYVIYHSLGGNDFNQLEQLEEGDIPPDDNPIGINATAGETYYIRVTGYEGPVNYGLTQTAGPGGVPDAPCFCAGTMIRTLRGETAVEALVPGDVLVLASGAVEVVRFVGVSTERAVGGRYKTDRLPVVIRQGALGENLPNADLRLAPGHAIAHGDLLVPAGRLVNGTTIVVDTAPVDLKYYHVRLDRHEVLISNGVASESFKHDPKWAAFDNAADYAERFPLDAAMTEAECRLAHREAGRRVTAKYPAPRDLLAMIAQRAEALMGTSVAVQAA